MLQYLIYYSTNVVPDIKVSPKKQVIKEFQYFDGRVKYLTQFTKTTEAFYRVRLILGILRIFIWSNIALGFWIKLLLLYFTEDLILQKMLPINNQFISKYNYTLTDYHSLRLHFSFCEEYNSNSLEGLD